MPLFLGTCDVACALGGAPVEALQIALKEDDLNVLVCAWEDLMNVCSKTLCRVRDTLCNL